MKIGVSMFAWDGEFALPQLDLLPQIRAGGLNGVEIPMFKPTDLPAKAIRMAFEASDIDCTVCAILPAQINPISPDTSVRKRALAHLIACVETAKELGASLLGGPLFAPIGYLPGHRRNKNEWDWAVECFQALGPALKANDLIFSIEPVNRSETFFLTKAADAKQLCEAIGDPRIGITVDTFHANIEEKNIPNSVRFLGKYLKHVHVSENDRGLLGSGHVDFPGLIQELNSIEYDGYLMIEGFGYSLDQPRSPGYLLADMNVSPGQIAFAGANYLKTLLR
jgi:D-psicose/D-tagatose/L-ribulose 3-epimerase